MKNTLPIVLVILIVLSGCGGTNAEENTYQQITQEEACHMMETLTDIILLDVREENEYAEGHIPGASLLPVGTINKDSAASVIPAKNSVVLVYCRSGNRSKTASAALAELGYTQIYEFGGINTWPYAIEQ